MSRRTAFLIGWVAIVVNPAWLSGACVALATDHHQWSLLIPAVLCAIIVAIALYEGFKNV